jgi:hypothetical protein
MWTQTDSSPHTRHLRIRWRWMVVPEGSHDALRDPRFLVGLVVLLTNDLILKVVAPGFLSGKLSDFAGMIVFPVILTSLAGLFGRDLAPRRAVAAISIWFAGLQMAAVADMIHENILDLLLPWSVVNTADPTDLIAFVMVPAALHILESSRPLQLSSRSTRVIVLAAALGCLADTGPPSDTVGPPALRNDGRVELLQQGDWSSGRFLSDDGGRSFIDFEALEPEVVDQLLDDSPGVRQTCLGSDFAHCFRLGESVFSVEESTDGGDSWSPSWQVGEDRYLLRDQGNSFLYPDERQRGIVVLPDDSVVVTTALGPTLVWSAAAGWTPTAVSLRVQLWPYFAVAALLAMSAVAFPLLRVPVPLAVFGSAMGLASAFSVGLLAVVSTFAALLAVILAIGFGLAFLICVAIAMVHRRRHRTRATSAVLQPAGLALAGLISTVPFLWWTFRPTTPLSGVLVSMIALAFGVALILIALVSESSSPRQ